MYVPRCNIVFSTESWVFFLTDVLRFLELAAHLLLHHLTLTSVRSLSSVYSWLITFLITFNYRVQIL